MSGMFAVRNVDKNTKKYIQTYAAERDLTLGEALREMVFLVQEHLAERKPKKYKSLFDTYEKIAFSSDDPHLSEKIDEIVYGGD